MLRMDNRAKNNPYDDFYRQQLSDSTLDTLLNNLSQKPDFEKRVYLSHMLGRYEDQIEKRIEDRASIMEDKVKAGRWKKGIYKNIKRYSKGVPGYGYEERTATLKTTANHRSFKLSRSNSFSVTFESTRKIDRFTGYIASAIVLGFVLYGGWVMYKNLPKMIELFDPPAHIEQILEEIER